MGGRFRASLVLALLASAGATALAGAGRTTSTVAEPSACAVRPGPLSYQWPVKPFHAAHPVRGNFGDPRTVFESSHGGRFSFHNGIDIAAADGTAVYPVLSGVVEERRPDELVVRTDDGRRFQYYHLFPMVELGQRVRRGRTVLGYVKPGAHHVHLSEIREGIVQNPLAPGHLTPYRDATPPVVASIRFLGPHERLLRPDRLTGTVTVVAQAYDLPSLSVPGVWHDFPVTPAALAWSLTSARGRAVVPDSLRVDFRQGEPRDEEFWRVYARGTIQNFPAVGRRFLYRRPGIYLFRATPAALDTRALRPGPYVLTVTALDVCGNSGSRSVAIRVLPQPPVPVVDALPRVRGRAEGPAVWPRGVDGYTVVLASLPRRLGAGDALAVVRRARADGLPDLGYLLSSHYSSLRPGFWVVFSGGYATPEQARSAAARDALFFPRSTVRQVVPERRLLRWPRARDGYTVVLASLPLSDGAAAARAEAERAAAAGIRGVGVLLSSRFASLGRGYYVVFAGVYRTPWAAERALARSAAVYPAAYPRAIRAG